ncbi:Rod binding protein [Pseudobythopirellula maris]|uniref:Rod binding protein n=1 Tax=Pseudobythopirellula maris TaxID=2527991 RepID=A0A5C5ZMZ5_9BACT|nr:rod-binding protein [Pseudobythopirellula maris]TWT88221.1 Rod binding protein [Pseudobythopirellula maris]
MDAISALKTSSTARLTGAGQQLAGLRSGGGAASDPVAKSRELQATFGEFVGETFFAHMLKASRQTVGEPAYFHGGRAEEAFQGQLDQQLAQVMTAREGAGFAQQMFEQQFPEHAELLKQVDAAQANTAPSDDPLEGLSQLRRR